MTNPKYQAPFEPLVLNVSFTNIIEFGGLIQTISKGNAQDCYDLEDDMRVEEGRE